MKCGSQRFSPKRRNHYCNSCKYDRALCICPAYVFLGQRYYSPRDVVFNCHIEQRRIPPLPQVLFCIIFGNQACLNRNLHSILALDPASNMSSPSQRTSESLHNVIPLDPASILNGTRLSEEQTRLNTGVDAYTQRDHGDDGKCGGGHLGHDGSKNLGGGVFTLPGHVLGEEGGGGGDFRSRGHLVGGSAGDGLGGGGESRGDGHDCGEEEDA
mmetsp:Transcript_16127/g.23928  ORF Transcript_16127/g.23928 Transcript_16127/m.23928 type:complete len:213 (-) Transcript_16127:67-705(-)